MSAFEQRMQEYITMINEAAAQYVSAEAFKGRESEGLSVMLDAMSYSLENGGKRIRPLLTLEFCCVRRRPPCRPAACARHRDDTHIFAHSR